MTTLFVLGSGSAGNAFAIASGGEVLLVDAGFSARELERRATVAGLDLGQATALVLTHEHGDHAAGVPRIAARLGIPVFASAGTKAAMTTKLGRVECRPLALLAATTHGAFVIEACLTSHDAAEPIALAIETVAGHRIGLAYDLGRPTAGVRYLLRDCHAIVLEANHDEILLRISDYPPVVQERIAGSGGHLSNRAAAELLLSVHHPALAAVVLAHLSERCNTPDHASGEIRAALGRCETRVHVARQEHPLEPIVLPALSAAALR